MQIPETPLGFCTAPAIVPGLILGLPRSGIAGRRAADKSRMSRVPSQIEASGGDARAFGPQRLMTMAELDRVFGV